MERANIDQSAAIVCSEVANKNMPIVYAERSEPEDKADSGWQFLCGSASEDWSKAEVWAIHEVLEREPSLKPFMLLPSGTVLTRKSATAEWQVREGVSPA